MNQVLTRIPIVNRLAIFLHKRKKRREGFERLRRHADDKPLRLVIGASRIHDPGWIGTDIEYLNLLAPSDWDAFFRKSSIDAILAEHVWEHLTIDEGLSAAACCFEYLKPGGYVRAAVPDGFCPDKDYVNFVTVGGSGPGSFDHKVLYNYLSFADIFHRAGFRVDLLEYYDAKGEFHFTDWDPEAGRILRSRRFDERNRDGKLKYTSLILDAVKDA